MYIVSIKTDKREESVPAIQMILTRYGDKIDSRIGLHNIGKEGKGLIIIIYNSDKHVEEFVEKLNGIPDVDVNYMEI